MAADEDDVLEAALAAQRRVEASTRAALGDGLRERILAGTLARQVAPSLAPRARRWTARRVLAATVASALVAGAVGYVVGRRAVPAPAPPAAPTVVRVPVPVPVPLPMVRPVIIAPPAPAAPPRRRPSGDLDEPLLVDQARAALRRRLPDEAIAALTRHEHEFPDGQLIEEREVLFVEAELMKGERAAARARIARYLARFPDGFLRGYVESLAPSAQ